MWSLLALLLGACGLCNGVPVESGRIIGGVEAPLQYAPYMVALVNEGHRTALVCGGSLIARRVVLTAAHCITHHLDGDGVLAQNLYGRVGSNIWHSGGTSVTFVSHYIHPAWDSENIKYDVGALILKDKVRLSSRVNLIELDFGWIGGNEKSFVTGWGVTGPRFEEHVVHLAPTPDELLLLDVSTLHPEECSAYFADAQWINAPALNPRVEVCTFHSVGHGMCSGDSGSPLVSRVSGRQFGLVSWGFPCAVGAPDVFTRLSGVQCFIAYVLKRHGDGKPKADLQYPDLCHDWPLELQY